MSKEEVKKCSNPKSVQKDDDLNDKNTKGKGKQTGDEAYEISINSNIMEVIEKFPRAAEIFAEYGLPCAGCVAASYESLADVVAEFGVDGEELVEAIKKSVEK